MANTRNVVISLFDYTGAMVQPWLNAGYECWIVDVQHPVAYETGGVTKEGKLYKVNWDLTKPWLFPGERSRIAFTSAFPPCDHLAVSGARWFKGKGLRRLALSVELFATAAEFCEWSEAPYVIENPVSNIASHWRKADHSFHPYEFTMLQPEDNYSKKTCLWTGGGFKMPKAMRDLDLGEPDDRIHKCPPGPERANIRSATPAGFAEAVFKANGKNLKRRRRTPA